MEKQDKKTNKTPVGNKNGEKIPQKKKAKRKTIEELMTRHIQNEDDVITPEEFKNVPVGLNVTETQHEPLEIDNKTERPKDEEKDHKNITPWDVIS